MRTTSNTIFYVEDDETDAFLVRLAFNRAGISNPLLIVSSGKEAIDYLSSASTGDAPQVTDLPCLVLLDLNMPGISGLEVLTWIRKNPSLSRLTVIVLSSSNQAADMDRATREGANGYVVKPGRIDDLIKMAKKIKENWLVQDRPSGEAAIP